MNTYTTDTVTTVVSAVSVRSSTRVDNKATVSEPLIPDDNHTIGTKRKRSPSPIDYAHSKKFKKCCPKCDEKRPRLVVSPSRSPTSASYSQASPAPGTASLSHGYYNDTLDDASPSDASARRALYELILIANDPPASDGSRDRSSYGSSSSRLCPTCERDTPLNATVPITGLDASSSYNILKSVSYTMVYWSQNLPSSSKCPAYPASPTRSPTAPSYGSQNNDETRMDID
ncbi:Hypothetical protein CINCED_3A000227 [Cinara cedri]|uniref:Uncharacterized protein n=1 Tax=Cinara cedri TaxID=506608 RepID=A0A5E4NB52_9HEMI|nr:Hypothetical protein CINCED_3A000227 [Cinara cedri]